MYKHDESLRFDNEGEDGVYFFMFPSVLHIDRNIHCSSCRGVKA